MKKKQKKKHKREQTLSCGVSFYKLFVLLLKLSLSLFFFSLLCGHIVIMEVIVLYIFFILFWTNRQEWTQKKNRPVGRSSYHDKREHSNKKKKLSASASAALDLYYVPHFKNKIYPLLVLNGHEAQYDAHKPLWVIHEYQATNSGWQVEENIYMDGGGGKQQG